MPQAHVLTEWRPKQSIWAENWATGPVSKCCFAVETVTLGQSPTKTKWFWDGGPVRKLHLDVDQIWWTEVSSQISAFSGHKKPAVVCKVAPEATKVTTKAAFGKNTCSIFWKRSNETKEDKFDKLFEQTFLNKLLEQIFFKDVFHLIAGLQLPRQHPVLVQLVVAPRAESLVVRPWVLLVVRPSFRAASTSVRTWRWSTARKSKPDDLNFEVWIPLVFVYTQCASLWFTRPSLLYNSLEHRLELGCPAKFSWLDSRLFPGAKCIIVPFPIKELIDVIAIAKWPQKKLFDGPQYVGKSMNLRLWDTDNTQFLRTHQTGERTQLARASAKQRKKIPTCPCSQRWGQEKQKEKIQKKATTYNIL